MKPLRIFVLAAVAMAFSVRARAQYLVFDIQSLAQLESLYSASTKQLTSLGNILQVNTQSLTAATQLNASIGTPGQGSSLLSSGNTGLLNIQPTVSQIPGMSGVNVSAIFPPNVLGAFLGKTMSQWVDMFSNPAGVVAQQLNQASMGGFAPSSSSATATASFSAFASSGESRPSGATAAYLSSAFAKLLTTLLLQQQQVQAQQQATYATEKQNLDQIAQNDSLTVLDRAKLSNNQHTLDIELQLNSMAAQNLSATAQAVGMDAQTRLLEEQQARESMDRATGP